MGCQRQGADAARPEGLAEGALACVRLEAGAALSLPALALLGGVSVNGPFCPHAAVSRTTDMARVAVMGALTALDRVDTLAWRCLSVITKFYRPCLPKIVKFLTSP